MDIVLALLRTLIFVVATVAVTVYVGRRIGRGHSLLWAGTTLLVLHWLIGFGWTTYRAGAPDTTPDVAGWVSWLGYLLPFLAALAFVWGIGQAAGVPARGGAVHGATTVVPTPHEGVQVGPSPVVGPAGVVPLAGSGSGSGSGSGTGTGSGHVVGPRVSPASARTTPPGAHTPSQPHRHKPARPPGLIVPHAVPVVMTPSASHHSPPDPDPVVDLGPEEDASPDIAVPPPGTPPIAPAGWAPVGPRPASSPAAPGSGSSSPEDGSAQSPVGGRPPS